MSIVLLGYVGVGKTSLYNKITQSQEKTSAGGNQTTLEVFKKKSSYGAGFLVIDTPGLEPEQNKLDHVAGVLCALSEGPINRIAILIKFARTITIIEQVNRMLIPFMNYRHMITVIVTVWDYCEKKVQEETATDIQSRLAEYQINSVMFVGKNDTSVSICQQIDQIIDKSKAENVNLTNTEIFQNFEIVDYNDFEFIEIWNEQMYFKGYYRKLYYTIKNFIQYLDWQNEILIDCFYVIAQFVKQSLEITIKKFESSALRCWDYLDENDQLKASQIHFQLKNDLFQTYKEIIDILDSKVYKEYQHAQYIKKCKYCGQFWFSLDSCNGESVCGRVDLMEQEETIEEFTITYMQEKLKIEHKTVYLREKQKLYQQNLSQGVEKMVLGNQTIKGSRVGCGRVIEWEKMDTLTEKELREVVSFLDIELCNQMIEFERQTKQKTLSQQIKYEKELQQKITEQKSKMRIMA
ncbi:unnamed protein product [Paramecium octaurelia]|uniref:G domain-containing protein n=1 Tax=Paramecium octaurelia TaxID=43137 RepID=A0A8S1TF54_PAROT|nr:unnamed protein product [Paramecium octaurelia]